MKLRVAAVLMVLGLFVPLLLSDDAPAAAPSLSASPAHSSGRESSVAPCMLSGSTASTEGTAIASATVCAYCASCSIGSSIAVACAKTTTHGEFSLDALTPGSYRLTASAPGYLSAAYEDIYTLTPGQHVGGVHMLLGAAGAALAGTVSDGLGGPVAGAHLLFFNSSGLLSGHTESNADGVFQTWLEPGVHGVLVRASGYASEQRNVIAPSADLDVVLMPSSSLAGTVVENSSGRPVADVIVRAVPIDVAVAESAPFAVTDGQGRFRIEALSPGAHRLEASSPQWRDLGAQHLELGVAEHVAGLSVRVVPATYVEARVMTMPDGVPCTRGYVTLSDERSGASSIPTVESVRRRQLEQVFNTDSAAVASSRLYSSPIGADGTVRFEGVSPGRYIASISCMGFKVDGAAPALEVLPSLEPVEAEWRVFPAPAIAIRPVNDAGEIVRSAQLRLQPLDEEYSIIPVREPDGRLVARSLEARTYRILDPSTMPEPATPSADRADSDRVVTLTNRSGLVEVDYTLHTVGELRVTVVRPDSRKFNGLTVIAKDPSSHAEFIGDNAADGEYALDALPAGTYEVHVIDGRNPPVTRSVSIASSQTTRVTLQYGFSGRIKGRVVDDQDSPVEGAWVDATLADGVDDSRRDPRRGAFADKAITSTDGFFELERLSESALYTVRAETRELRAVVRDVRTGTEVKLVFSEPLTLRGRVLQSDGTPASRFVVSSQHVQTGLVRGSQADDPEGRFTIHGMQPGELFLRALDPRGAIATLQTSVISPASELVLILRAP